MSAPPPKEPSLTALLNALDRVSATDYHEVEIRIGATRLRVSRGPSVSAAAPAAAAAAPPAAETAPGGAAHGAALSDSGTDSGTDSGANTGADTGAEDANRKTVPSPMVGTFYRRPRPDAEPFVNPGDRVQPGQVVCIIEAMKLMNNIEAETAGVVEEILPEDGAAVQFGDPLFVLRTD